MNYDNQIFTYRIDENDNIISVSKNWDKFAEDNKANSETCKSPFILNKSIWDFFVDPETIHLYQILVNKVRESKKALNVQIRCDSPKLRRFIKISMKALQDNHIEFSSKIVKIEEREPVLILDSTKERSEELLKICSYCKQIKISEKRWIETEEAVVNLRLLEDDKLPRITHGICPNCSKNLMNEYEKGN